MLLEDFNKKLAERDAEIEKLTRERDIALKGLDNIEVQRVGAVCKLEDTRVERDSFRDSAQKYERELIWAKESLNNVIGENHRHKDFIESQKVEVFAYRAEIERLRKALEVFNPIKPWGTISCLEKLSEAADILLLEKDYDRDGWESFSHASKSAKEIAAAYQALASGKEEAPKSVITVKHQDISVRVDPYLTGGCLERDTVFQVDSGGKEAPKEVNKWCQTCLYANTKVSICMGSEEGITINPKHVCIGWQPKAEVGKAV
jgi:hypothetical protein